MLALYDEDLHHQHSAQLLPLNTGVLHLFSRLSQSLTLSSVDSGHDSCWRSPDSWQCCSRCSAVMTSALYDEDLYHQRSCTTPVFQVVRAWSSAVLTRARILLGDHQTAAADVQQLQWQHYMMVTFITSIPFYICCSTLILHLYSRLSQISTFSFVDLAMILA